MPWRSGFLPMALRAQCINWTRKSVAPLECPSGILPRATAIHLGASILNSCPMNACAKPTNLTIPTCQVQIQVTVTLKKVSLGTELNIVQEGLPDAIPPEACYLGWQESLRNLAKLVEPEIIQ